MRAALLALLLSGCAINGELPTDTVINGSHWYKQPFPFAFQRLEWNHITGGGYDERMDRVARLCGFDPPSFSQGCALRVAENGQCVVFSIYSETEAKRVRDPGGETHFEHETRHCGVGMPEPGAWHHRALVVLR